MISHAALLAVAAAKSVSVVWLARKVRRPQMATTLLHRLLNAAKAKSSTRRLEAELRVLIVQHKGGSSEAKVVSTLISSMQHDMSDTTPNAVMVLQFGREQLSHGARLLALPEVELVSIDIGGSLGVKQPRHRMIIYLSRLVLSLPRILTQVRRFHPDVIYSSQQRWDVRLAILLASAFRRPHVIHLHYTPGPWLGGGIVWWLKKCQQVICVSEFIRQRAIEAGVSADRCLVIRNVLPPETVATAVSREEARKALCNLLNIPAADVLVGMVARMDPGKGHHELVRAVAPLLSENGAHCQLILVGAETDPDAHYAQRVLDIVESVNIAARVHWLGNRADVPDLLRAFDVFAHPSFDDPCPLSVIEALLAGLPCIVWRDGGAAELVVDRVTGLVVETGNIVALTTALRALCQDEAFRERMHRACLASVDRVSNTQYTARLFREALLQDIAMPSKRDRRGQRSRELR